MHAVGTRVMISLAGLYCGMYHISYHNSYLRCFLSILTVSERLNEQKVRYYVASNISINVLLAKGDVLSNHFFFFWGQNICDLGYLSLWWLSYNFLQTWLKKLFVFQPNNFASLLHLGVFHPYGEQLFFNCQWLTRQHHVPVVFTITWRNIAYYIITTDKKLIYALGLEKFETFKLVYNAAWVCGLIQGLVSIVLFTQGLVSVFLFKHWVA